MKDSPMSQHKEESDSDDEEPIVSSHKKKHAALRVFDDSDDDKPLFIAKTTGIKCDNLSSMRQENSLHAEQDRTSTVTHLSICISVGDEEADICSKSHSVANSPGPSKGSQSNCNEDDNDGSSSSEKDEGAQGKSRHIVEDRASLLRKMSSSSEGESEKENSVEAPSVSASHPSSKGSVSKEKSFPSKPLLPSQSCLNADIFDAEMNSSSDDDNDRRKHQASSDDDAYSTRKGRTEDISDNDDDDNDEDRGEISAALKRRLKKGAAKQPGRGSSTKPKPPTKEDVTQLHSETQRLIRSSSLRIPYHQPPKADLSQFLARTEQKQQALSVRTAAAGARPAWKQLPSAQAFRTTSPLTWNIETSKLASRLNQRIEGKNEEVKSLHILDSGVNLAEGGVAIVCSNECSNLKTVTSRSQLDSSDEDALPDLVIDSNTQKFDDGNYSLKSSDVTVTQNMSSTTCELVTACPLEEIRRDECSSVHEPKNSLCAEVIPTLKQFGSSSNNSCNETNSMSHTPSSQPVMVVSNVLRDDVIQAACHLNIDATRQKQESENISASGGTSCLTPRMAICSLASGSMPRLGWGTMEGTGFIDLDEEKDVEDDGVISGVKGLMDRMIRHSMCGFGERKEEKRKIVEISIVSKEKVDGDREELKVDKFSYLSDVVDENKPGAKLCHLREELKLRMRAKREEALAKRYEAFAADHEREGGYEMKRLEEEVRKEEEAELTDQTDTDGEDESEEEEEMDEDDEEKMLKKKSNPFVDEEADDDDGDEGADPDDENDDSDGEDNDGDEESDDEKLASDGENENGNEDGADEDESGAKNKSSKVIDHSDDSSEASFHLCLETQDTRESQTATCLPSLNHAVPFHNRISTLISENPTLDSESMLLNLELDSEGFVRDGLTSDGNNAIQQWKGETRRGGGGVGSKQKHAMLDFHDEDANTESPTTSQKSNLDKIEVYDRPFVQVGSTSLNGLDQPIKKMLTDDDLGEVIHRLRDPMDMEQDSTHDTSCASQSMHVSGVLLSADSSFDMIGSLVPAAQRQRRVLTTSVSVEERITPDLFATTSSVSSASGLNRALTDPDSRRTSSLAVDESNMTTTPCHLHGEDDAARRRQTESTPQIKSSQTSFRFHLGEDTGNNGGVSQVDWMFDDLVSNKDVDSTRGRRRLLDTSPTLFDMQGAPELCTGSTQGNNNMDELLHLCSGTFTKRSSDDVAADSNRNGTSKSLFSRGNSFVVTGGSSQSGDGEDPDEILGLCSGKFTNIRPGNDSSSKNNSCHFGLYSQDDESMGSDRLLRVLSGEFAKKIEGPASCSANTLASRRLKSSKDVHYGKTALNECETFKRTKKRKAVIRDDDDDDDFLNDVVADAAEDSFEIASPRRHHTDDTDESSDEEHLTDDNDDADDSESRRKSTKRLSSGETSRKFSGFVNGKKKGKIRAEFVEAEAELSGSEAGSDDNYDIDENEDVLEAEAGDEDDVGTEEELRNQVHRVHLKTLIDADKREIRLLQEQYLTDGDLHEDGMGRMRRFRWQNADDADQDLFKKSDGEDEEEEEGETEAKWRTERLEREKFLQQQKSQENEDMEEEGSQLLKLGQALYRQQSSSQDSSSSQPHTAAPQPQKNKGLLTHLSHSSPADTGLFKIPNLSHGSFLYRSKESLAKIVEMSKPVANPNGPTASRNFVFTAIAAAVETEKSSVAKPPPVSRSTSVTTPVLKRPRLDRSNSISSTSIFALFDRAS